MVDRGKDQRPALLQVADSLSGFLELSMAKLEEKSRKKTEEKSIQIASSTIQSTNDEKISGIY